MTTPTFLNVFKFDPARDAGLIPQIVDLLRKCGHDRDIEITKHSIFVCELAGKIEGVLAEILIPVVDTLEVEKSPLSLSVAQALTDYAKGYTLASGCKEVMFTIREDNQSMRRFVEDRGAKLEGVYATYTMEVQ